MITTSNLRLLYSQYNNDYFKGLLPDIDLEISGKLVKTFGQMVYTKGEKKPIKIIISEKFLHDTEYLRNSLVHEMIHAWQYHKYIESGDEKFIDKQAQAGFPFVNQGHGRYFLEIADRLNKKYPELNINVTADLLDIKDHSFEQTAVIVEFRALNGHNMHALYFTPTPSSKIDLNGLKSDLDIIYGASLRSARIIESSKAIVGAGKQLTAKGRVRKNNNNRFSIKDVIIKQLETEDSVVEWHSEKLTKEQSQSIPVKVLSAVEQTGNIRAESFIKYIQYVYAKAAITITDPYLLIAGEHEECDSVARDYLHRQWVNTPESIIKQSSAIKVLTNKTLTSILKNQPADQDAWIKTWIAAGCERTSFDEIKKAVARGVKTKSKKFRSLNDSRVFAHLNGVEDPGFLSKEYIVDRSKLLADSKGLNAEKARHKIISALLQCGHDLSDYECGQKSNPDVNASKIHLMSC